MKVLAPDRTAPAGLRPRGSRLQAVWPWATRGRSPQRELAGVTGLAASVAWCSMMLACAPGIPGEHGRIDYHPGGEPSLFAATYAIARGGTAVYGIEPERGEGDLVEVESLTPDVVEVVSFTVDQFTVRGVGAGAARVRTRTSITEDVAPLEVAEIARVHVIPDFTPEWREILLHAAPDFVPPSGSIALVRGAPPVPMRFGLEDASGRPLMDTSAVLLMSLAATSPDAAQRVEVVAGGGLFPLDIPVVDRADRLVRHGVAADLVWALGPDSVFCVAPMAGPHSLASYPLRAEVSLPWTVTAEQPFSEAPFATCFLVGLEPSGVPQPADVVVTDGSSTFVQRVESP